MQRSLSTLYHVISASSLLADLENTTLGESTCRPRWISFKSLRVCSKSCTILLELELELEQK